MRNALIAIALVAANSSVAIAQNERYDKSRETMVSGPIRYVISGASQDGVVGVHIELKTPSGPVRVALGPALFIASKARTITKDGKNFLVLRDEDGTPRWERATDDPDGCGVSHAPIR